MSNHTVVTPDRRCKGGLREVLTFPYGTGVGYQGAMSFAHGRRDADVWCKGEILAQRRDGAWVVACDATPLEARE